MMTKFFKNLLFLIVLFGNISISYAELYSGGPWRGRVIDADTKEPIEGVVVAAVWYRKYDSGFGGWPIFHEAKEVLTDKNGAFEIPIYVENRGKVFWRVQDLKGDVKAELLYSGPIIKEPEFIIYKPSYGGHPEYVDLYVFAIGPANVEYLELHKGIYKGKEVVEYGEKKIKTFPEGVVYYGKRCLHKIKALNKSVFDIEGFFIPLPNARERIKNLNVPLDCPDNGEIIPDIQHGYKSDIKENYRVMENEYVIIELSKSKTEEEHLYAPPSMPDEADANKLPLLYKLINQGNKNIEPLENKEKRQ